MANNKAIGTAFSDPQLESITLDNGVIIFQGVAATRAAVRALVGDTPPIGSVFFSTGAVATTKPNAYIKVLNVPGNTDWERIVTAATD